MLQINYQKAPAGLPFPHYATQHIDAKPRHILVLAHNTFYKVDVLSTDGAPYSAGQIQASLEAILAAKPAAGAGQAEAIGNLTAQNRDVWADARNSLCMSAENEKTFNEIDSGACMFLCTMACIDVMSAWVGERSAVRGCA